VSLDEVVLSCVGMLERAVRAEVAARLDDAVADALRRRSLSGAEPTRSRAGRLCPVPGCGLLAAGPRYSWRCRGHKSVTKDELARMMAGSGEPRVTRLPPGPRPDAPRRPGPPMGCRAPGCVRKSRGPRYEFFCAEHWGTLTRDQRQAASSQWRQASEGGAVAAATPEPGFKIRKPGAARTEGGMATTAPASAGDFVFPVSRGNQRDKPE
jgi:hypothetical protein